ncbi:MAG TPA: peptidoglycan-associated lipoprotein Pal [Myxococcota bacterium]|nr:peptidoglycan-associated lipoprotein Pal [Myxococcota bacterium]
MEPVATYTPPAPEVAPPPPPPPPAPPAPPQAFVRVYFDYDSAVLSAEAKRGLDANLQLLKEYPELRLEVQGHCDERGSTEYNLALGDRRANAVRKYLKAAGIAASRVKIISYGEERPLRPGESEDSWSQNRRAEFVVEGGDPNKVVGSGR